MSTQRPDKKILQQQVAELEKQLAAKKAELAAA